MGVIMYLMFYYSGDLPFTAPDNSTDGRCTKILGLPNAYFPISDVAVQDSKIWVSGPFQVGFKAPDADWTWMAMNGKKVSAIVPTTSGSFYVAIEKPGFDLQNMNSDHSVVETFDMSSLRDSFDISLKALTFIDDSNFLVADGVGSIYQVKINRDRSPSYLELVSMIPSQRLAVGILNENHYKQISGLYYQRETSMLFVLFSNYRTLRVFDFKSATLLNEWYLPGTSFQWSGISVDGSFLYLSQSIPSGIWKFQIQGNVTTGKIFPSCANVYEGDLIEIINQSAQGDRFRRNRPDYVTDY
jgi:hypothetical protein